MAINDQPLRSRCLEWLGTIESFAMRPATEGTLFRMHTMHAAD